MRGMDGDPSLKGDEDEPAPGDKAVLGLAGDLLSFRELLALERIESWLSSAAPRDRNESWLASPRL